MLSTFLLSMFFLGMLGLVDIVNDPFGDDVDDFSPDSLLFSAERHLFAFLANPGKTNVFFVSQDVRTLNVLSSFRPRLFERAPKRTEGV